MPKSSVYRTAPESSSAMPKGIPYIIGNEAAERFSYYGMKAILTVFMTRYLVNSAGQLDTMSGAEATAYYHLFSTAVYFFPILGALLSDVFLGKYRTIMGLSVVYCLGHLTLAIDDTRTGLAIGLTLIAVGSGGIKPCVSANVGDQFGARNQDLMAKVFSWFYLAINFGAFISSLATPVLLHRVGPAAAFGLPGALMFLATFVFWLGRKRFVHIPAGGMAFVRETFSPDGRAAVARLALLYLFVAPFWALFDQTGSSWVLQSEKMDLHFMGMEWLPSQIQSANPILILILVPIFAYGVYPLVERFARVTPLRKIGSGFFVAAAAFGVVGLAEAQIAAGNKPSIGWQLVAYLILTAAEVMVSITCLEYSYTQAPKKMKSAIMAVFLFSVSLGNFFTAGVNFFIENPDGTTRLQGPAYFWFFAGVMLVTALLFVPFAQRFKEHTYIQDDADQAQADTVPLHQGANSAAA